MKKKAGKPFQFGLKTLFAIMAVVAVVLGLGWAWWAHIGGVAVQVLVALAALSVVGGLLALPLLVAATLPKAYELAQLLVDYWEARQAARKAESEEEDDAD